MDLTRRSLLASAGAALAVGGPALAVGGAAVARPDYLVVIYAAGGWDTSYALDPKLHSDWFDGPDLDAGPHPDDVNEVQTFGEMPIVVNPFRRPAVGSFFENWWSRTAVINGISVGSIAHQAARVRLFTGTTSAARPDFTAIVGAARGGSRPLGSVDLSNRGLAGPLAPSVGRIGASSQLEALIDPDIVLPAPPGAPQPPLHRPDLASESLVRDYLLKREAMLREEHAANPLGAGAALDAYLESYDRRTKLLEQAKPLTDGLTLGKAPNLVTQIEVMISLLSNDICQSVLMNHNGHDWDTHASNDAQNGHYESLFLGLDSVASALESAGLLDRTLVLVLSEMSRTPRRNSLGGKDHWSFTSALLLGAGFEPGRTYGATDDYGEALTVDPETGEVDPGGELITHTALVAGILEHMDVDPARWLGSVAPFRGPWS